MSGQPRGMVRNNERRNEWLLDNHVCAICGIEYTNQKALGKHECREHPGIIQLGRWTCCGLIVSKELRTARLFYSRPFSLPLLGCVRCDHKQTLEAYSNKPRIDYRDIGGRLDGSTVLLKTQLINGNMFNPTEESYGYVDTEFTEVYRYSKEDYDAILKKPF